VKMSLEDAIRLVQIHERARQGRLRAKFMREIRHSRRNVRRKLHCAELQHLTPRSRPSESRRSVLPSHLLILT